jgi:iron complex outermembrane recepter protein
MSEHKIKTRLAAMLAAPIFCSGTVLAQQLEEVLVTAERRSESIQDVPLSVAAMTSRSAGYLTSTISPSRFPG